MQSCKIAQVVRRPTVITSAGMERFYLFLYQTIVSPGTSRLPRTACTILIHVVSLRFTVVGVSALGRELNWSNDQLLPLLVVVSFSFLLVLLYCLTVPPIKTAWPLIFRERVVVGVFCDWIQNSFPVEEDESITAVRHTALLVERYDVLAPNMLDFSIMITFGQNS